MGYKYSSRAKGKSEELQRAPGAGRAPGEGGGSTWGVINSSAFLPRRRRRWERLAREAQGTSFLSEPHRGGVCHLPKTCP